MDFVSNRNIVVASKTGHAVDFKKGVPTYAPRSMHAELMAIGVLPVNENGEPVDPAENKVIEADKPIITAPEDALEREDHILKVIKEVVARNKPAEFTGGGVPSVETVTAALGWKVDKKEVRDVWVKHREALLDQNKKQD